MANHWLGVFIAALAVTLLFVSQASAQQVEKTGFNTVPDKFFYFKDSKVMLYRMIYACVVPRRSHIYSRLSYGLMPVHTLFGVPTIMANNGNKYMIFQVILQPICSNIPMIRIRYEKERERDFKRTRLDLTGEIL